MDGVEEGTLLWEPSDRSRAETNMAAFMAWLREERGLVANDYHDLWQWSVEDLESFWGAVWDYYDVEHSAAPDTVLSSHAMPGADGYAGDPPGQLWFHGAALNYAEQVIRNRTDDRPALLTAAERRPLEAVSWDDLADDVAGVAAALREFGVGPGDRVVGFLPHVPEAVVAFLATASVGAVWSCCSPDFGATSVLDRFQQLEPEILFFCDGYAYGGNAYDKTDVIDDIQASLPTLERSVLVPHLDGSADPADFEATVHWDDVRDTPNSGHTFEQVAFDHPLWVLFSSGTTGPPKPIVHGHGGIVLEHLKILDLHTDLGPGDRFFWYTSTGWMMWNYLVGGLLVGATPILYDGSPVYPDHDVLWQLAEESEMNVFGTSASYLLECMDRGLEPGANYDLSALESIGQTASPLPPEGFQYVYESIKEDVWFASVSGGTDVCTAFIGGSPLLPVHAGEIQCRALGAKVEVYDDEGSPVVGRPGELVLTEPMPSMPIYFWDDTDDERLAESYFETFPGVWRHGDFAKLTDRGSMVVYGRSDSVINKQGVRFGTSEIYSAVNDIDGIVDSLATGVQLSDGGYYFPLFVVLEEGVTFDDALVEEIRSTVRSKLSPRHTPDEVFEVEAIPRNLTGKKLEVPVKNLIKGMPLSEAVNPDAVGDPATIERFEELARRIDIEA